MRYISAGLQAVWRREVRVGSAAFFLLLVHRDTARPQNMLRFLYYFLTLVVCYVFYRYGQKLLRKGYRDEETGEPTQGMLGPIGFLLCGGFACFLWFAVLRALAWGEVQCAGKGCKGQTYTLAAHPGPFWDNIFYLVVMALLMSYGVYVTFKIWTRP